MLISAQTWFYCKIASRLWFRCSFSAKNHINWSFKNGWITVLDLHLKCKYTVEPSLTATSFPVHWGQPKTWSIHEVKTTNRSSSTGNRDSRRNLFWLSKTSPGKFFSRFLPLMGSGQIQRKTKKSFFFPTFLGLKDCVGFKGRREISRYQVVPFAILTNFGFNLSVIACAAENPYKNGEFGWFSARKTQWNPIRWH